MIKFLQDYTTEALPPEHFKKGEEVSRSEESESYFVGRGLAGYLVDGKLVDADLRPIVVETVAVEIVQPGERRADLFGARAGEVMTGQPPRATSGPGVPFVEPAGGIAGAPAVVLEAEIERLKAALETGNDLFRDMNNMHVGTIEGLRGEVARLTKELADANGEGDDAVIQRDKAVSDLGELRRQHDDLVDEYRSAREQFDQRGDRIAELEKQLAEAVAKKTAK